MRKIDKESTDAFINGINYKNDNTTVVSDNNITELRLFGHCIARKTIQGIEVNHHGYQSNTTLRRLRNIPGVSIQVKKGIWYLNGKEMNSGWNQI